MLGRKAGSLAVSVTAKRMPRALRKKVSFGKTGGFVSNTLRATGNSSRVILLWEKARMSYNVEFTWMFICFKEDAWRVLVKTDTQEGRRGGGYSFPV